MKTKRASGTREKMRKQGTLFSILLKNNWSFLWVNKTKRMWLEYWGGALCDETKTAERETRLRGVY